MKLEIFDASSNNWDDVEEMRQKLNVFLAEHAQNVIKTTEVAIGTFIVIFVYVKI